GPVELQRVGDAVTQEGVHHEPVLVGGDHLLLVGLEGQVAAVESDDALEEGGLHLEPPSAPPPRGAGPHPPPAAGDDGLLPLVDDEQGVGDDHQAYERDHAPGDELAAGHWAALAGACPWASGAGWVTGADLRCSASGGSTTGAMDPLEPRITLF